MKRNLFLLTFMVICSGIIFAMPSDTRKQIKMKVRQRIEHRSTNLFTPVQVYINNAVLEIEFESPIDNVTILVTNSTTGEIVYQEKIASTEKFKFIDLFEKDKNTEYVLEISSTFWKTTGILIID